MVGRPPIAGGLDGLQTCNAGDETQEEIEGLWRGITVECSDGEVVGL